MGAALMRRWVLTTAVAAAVAVPLAVPAALAQPGGAHASGLRAGAASADITPPAFGTLPAPDPATCVPVDGSGPFNGPRQFALEEPYADLNGNGVYDAPDPTTGAQGEPFLDCPTPTALGGIRPPDGRWDGIYLGGGDCCDRLASGKVFDPLEADALVLDNDGKRIAVVTVDNEGVFKEIWDLVRQKVAADGVRLDAVFPSSTHDESAPDTIGITGPAQTTSGVDPFYVEFFVARVAGAIERAAAHLTPARVRYGSIRPDNLIPCWSSYPFVADESVHAMQVLPVHGHDAAPVATLVDYGIHAEELGFDPVTRHDISGDWWHFLRTSIRAAYGDAPVLSMAGPVGSVEMPMILSGAFDKTPVGVHKFSSRDGCTTIYSGPPQLVEHEGGYATYTKTLGETVASWATQALTDGEWSRSDQLSFALRTIQAPVTNALFLAAAPACVFDYRIFYVSGVATGTGTPPACGAGNEIATDVGYFRIGDGSFVTAPGELFPLTYAHDFHGPEGLADPTAGPVHGWVMAQLGGKWRFVDGLGADLSGYIFPASNEVGTPTVTNPNASDVDRFDCHHVDDGEASSGNEGDVVDDALTSLLPPSVTDVVKAGRYVYADGSLHRDPSGDGILGCDAATSGFTPAPGGGAVAVRVTGGPTYTPGADDVRWMDLDGRAQSAPDQQTRGVILGDGQRVWLDVYPGG
jgi:hypothetical protein